MSNLEIAKQNFVLALRFNTYAVRHPSIIKKLPSDSQMIFLAGSAILKKHNLALGRTLRKRGVRVFQAIEIKKNWTVRELSN